MNYMESTNIILAANEYEEYREKIKVEKEFFEKKIKEFERIISMNYNKDIYALIYKEEYGDYSKFHELVSKELANRKSKSFDDFVKKMQEK